MRFTEKACTQLAETLVDAAVEPKYALIHHVRETLRLHCQGWTLWQRRRLFDAAIAILFLEAEDIVAELSPEGLTEEEIAYGQLCLDTMDELNRVGMRFA